MTLIKFKEYLEEAATGSEADRHGKTHELLTGWHLNRLIHGKGAHMSHFRDENGMTPEQALGHHTKDMKEDELHHHNNKAMKAAEAIHKHIKSKHPEILNVNKAKGEHNRVTWTSQKNDVENLTGKRDKAQEAGGADVMVTRHNATGHVEKDHHAYGASLKFLGKKSKVTHANRGMGSIEKQLGMPDGHLTKHDEAHKERVDGVFGKQSAAKHHLSYKEIRDNKAPTAEQTAKKKLVNDSDTKRNQEHAKAITEHLNSMTPDERRHHLTNVLAPEHTHPNYQVRTNHDDDKPTHIEHTHDTVRTALHGDHHIVHEGRYIHVHSGTKEKPGARLASIEIRSKGKPAGHAAQACPTFTAEMSKHGKSEV
jgi:hypothetical protein